MLVELYNIVMAVTMAVAGILMTRDYVRFLKSTQRCDATVKSIQHVFTPSGARFGTKSGYYPVLEYASENGPVQFTCIDEQAANRFHIGDNIRLYVSKSRRCRTRNCKTFLLLSSLLAVLVFGILGSAAMPETGLSVTHIIVSSFVVAISLFVIVRFKREQDEAESLQTIDIDGGNARYWLKEPTAFKHWRKCFGDKRQANRVRVSQAFGACCFVASAGIALGAILPAFS